MKLLMGTRQFKMYLDDEIVERLEALAVKHGLRSGQQVVEELLQVYLPVWATVSDSMKRAVAFQTRAQTVRQTEKTQTLPVLKEKAK